MTIRSPGVSYALLQVDRPEQGGDAVLFVGDDWAEDHPDIELVDDEGNVLARRRLVEGMQGVAGLHAVIADHLPEDWVDLEPGQAQVKVGIETTAAPGWRRWSRRV